MDVKQYYKKIREVESTLPGQYVFVVSLATPDGGKPGVVSEVTREVAAKMIVEARAVPASDDDKGAFLEQQLVARKAAHKADLARRIQVAIIAEPDVEPQATNKKLNNPGGRN